MRTSLPKPAGRLRRLARTGARIAIALVVALLTLLAAGYAAGAERFWPVAQAQYVPYPVFLLPALSAAGLSLLLGWPWRVLACLAVVLVLVVFMGFEANVGGGHGERLRVMTYNIKGYVAREREGGFREIAREIALHDPDILVLQDARELKAARLSDPESTRTILGERHVFSFGQYVVASRYPLRECGHRLIAVRDQDHTYVSCVVVARGTEIDLVTAHLLTPRHGLNATREDPVEGIDDWKQNVAGRLGQAEILAQDLRKRWRPVILAGDLNAPVGSLVVRALLETGLRDAFSEAGTGFGYTWGHSLRTGFSFLRIDHILASPEFEVARCFTGGKQGSAHRPVIADLHFVGRSG